MTLTQSTHSVLTTLPSVFSAPSGRFTYVLYPDRTDYLTLKELTAVMEVDDSHYDALIDLLDEAYAEAFDDALDELLDEVLDHWDTVDDPMPWDAADEDTVREIVRNAVDFVLDYDHFCAKRSISTFSSTPAMGMQILHTIIGSIGMP